MFKQFKREWRVVIRNVEDANIIQAEEQFIARDWTAWNVWDSIGRFRKKIQDEKSGNWRIVVMDRV